MHQARRSFGLGMLASMATGLAAGAGPARGATPAARPWRAPPWPGPLPAALPPQDPAWPDGPLPLLVPTAPGGSTHFLGRFLARQLGRLLGHGVTVQNQPGLGGMAGTCTAGLGAPDGPALLLSPSTAYAFAAHLHPCPVPLLRNLAPLGLLARSPQAICVLDGSGLTTLEALIHAARHAPGALRYATPVAPHPTALLLADAAELQLSVVPTEGTASTLQALEQDQADFACLNLCSALPRLRGGALQLLAVTSAERVPDLPDVPTLAELLDQPGLHITTDFALFARRGLGEALTQALAQATREAMLSAEARELLPPLGLTLLAGPPEAFAATLEAESRRWLVTLRQQGLARP
ncbi:tripartite tricarboxylate transporter substrate binding protein [Roseomonas sp. GC11]|uniref:tripartite tricarboxylate transporter substrate binding protein n=1 Tax=Roseomonas sp. GC11 TaxID=2950546 RepID=UPI00210EE8E8|nr:tripartite tricarboxylate transporter substrate binding protein [Roseomonas sp. GC11]MCQ4162539.1 tripartite tricarboxylate transporter substrate binding protein [Roseomonas sp. GC11]